MTTSNTYGRAVDVPMVNKSGAGVVLGDAVIYDTTNNDAFTTSTSTGSTLACGIAQETIANNGTGRIRTLGYTSLATPTASVTRGHYGYIGGVAKQVTDAGASRVAGTFLYFLSGGTTPDAIIYPVDLAGAALTNPMSHEGALIRGGSSGTPTELTVGTSGKLLASNGTDPLWDAGTGLLLDFNLAADVTNQALTAATFFDLFANQNFTKVYTNSLIEVAVRGMGFCNDNVVNEYLLRVNIDSAGTPVLKYISGQNNAYTTSPVNARANVLGGGSVYISGLSAATHTIKAQFAALVNNDHLFCRASTNGPTTGAEFFNVQVIEHL